MKRLFPKISAAFLILLIAISIAEKVSAIEEKFEDSIIIIGCINSNTYETRYPNAHGNCFYGNGWQNIMLPPKSHLEIWKDVFKNDEMIINRLPIVNFESGFDENAGNKFAKGYVQTLRSYKVPSDIRSQLEWMRERQESQKNGNCSQWKENDRIMRCLYARHYGATDGFDWYPNKAMAARNFYITYFSK